MLISKLYISLLADPEWPIEAVSLYTKKDFLAATRSDKGLTYKTTIFDLDKMGVCNTEILDQVSEIYLIEDTYPFDNESDYSILFWIAELCNRNVANAIIIKDKINSDLNELRAVRSTDKSILWTAGCSFTAGQSVEWEQRYGTLLAEKLGIPEVSLSRSASSIGWAADQLLRSDIRPGDIVVWGLTDSARIDTNKEFSLRSTPAIQYLTKVNKEKQYWNIDYFGSLTQEVSVARTVLQVINYFNRIGVKLILANLLNNTILKLIESNHKNTIDLTTKEYLDLGTDNEHPGPKQHEHYANEIYNFIKGKK